MQQAAPITRAEAARAPLTQPRRVVRKARPLPLADQDRALIGLALKAAQAADEQGADPVEAARKALAGISEGGRYLVSRAQVDDLIATGLQTLNDLERRIAQAVLTFSAEKRAEVRALARNLQEALR